MALTVLETRFYESVPSYLKDIADALKVIAGLNEKQPESTHKPEETTIASINLLKPYWDGKRQAVFVPVINKFLDAKRLTDEEVEWEEGIKLAKEAGKELPSQHDMFALLLFKDEINAIISVHGGDILEDWEWSSSEYSAGYAWNVYFNYGGVYYYSKCGYNYVRAVAA